MEFDAGDMHLRHWRESDYKVLYQLARNPEVARSSGWRAHSSEQDSLEVIRTTLCQEECYAICLGDTPIGCIELYDWGRSNLGISEGEWELGGWIGRDHWFTGMIQEAAEPIIDHAFDDLGAEAVIAPTYSENVFFEQDIQKYGFEFMSADGCPELCSDEIRPGTVYRLTSDAWHRYRESKKD